MSLSFSCTSNGSRFHPNNSSINTIQSFIDCFFTEPSRMLFSAFIMTNNLILIPLCIWIFYLGLTKWWHRNSTTTAMMISHTDSFTYHLVAMEMIGVSGSIVSLFGIYSNCVTTFMLGFYCMSINWYGESFFHTLTTLERYLAVVFPIVYLSLKHDRGIRLRNISIGCVWLLSLGTAISKITARNSVIFDLCMLFLFLMTVSLCSVSVLWVLTHAGPGEHGKRREKIEPSKRKAFYTIVSILCVLCLRFSWNIIWFIWRRQDQSCMIMIGFWFNLPCSLVLPVLFLHKAGELNCFKTATHMETE